MKLGVNLQLLRKKKGMSQEEVAEKLQVSRQAVSKWETGETVPEIEKLMMISELYNCSIDTLMKGDIDDNNSNEKNIYDSFMNKFSKGISLGVFLILVGVTIFLTILNFRSGHTDQYVYIAVAILMIFIIVAVPIFIILGIEMDNLNKKYNNLTNLYTEEEIDKYNSKFAITIAFSVSIILIGVIGMLLTYGLHIFANNSLMPIVILMAFVTMAVPFIVNAGIQKDKFEMVSYKNFHHYPSKEMEEKVGKFSAVIMISATIIYFILGFIFNLWHINWIVYPIGGMLCGIVAVILNNEV